MIILGIDPGTQCGWAVLEDSRLVASGVWDLSPRRHEGGGMRFVKLLDSFCTVVQKSRPETIAYEEVAAHRGTAAAQIYGGIVATIQTVCERNKLPYTGIPVGTIKKLATGKGNANKQAMVEAFRRRFGREPQDDNEADAAFVALTLADQRGLLQPAWPENWREG